MLLTLLGLASWLHAQDTPSPSPAQQPVASAGASVSSQELANQVNNPAAPVTFIQFRDILLPSPSATNGTVNALQMQPVLPIGPFHSFPHAQWRQRCRLR
jgi:hypothetical protein